MVIVYCDQASQEKGEVTLNQMLAFKRLKGIYCLVCLSFNKKGNKLRVVELF